VEPGAIFLLIGVCAIVVLFVAWPFTDHWLSKGQSSREVSSLLAEYERTLSALEELDFDHGLGKVPVDEYSAQRTSLLQKGSDVLRRLDELHGEQLSPAEEPVYRTASQEPIKLISEDDLEDLISKHRSAQPQKNARFCSKCGRPISHSDQFCPSCGQVFN
jgi:hypothetical protein